MLICALPTASDVYTSSVSDVRRAMLTEVCPNVSNLTLTALCYTGSVLAAITIHCGQSGAMAIVLYDVCTTLHCTTLHCTTLPYTALHCPTLHYTTPYYTTLHYIILFYTAHHYIPLHYFSLHYTTLRYATLHYTILHYTGPD